MGRGGAALLGSNEKAIARGEGWYVHVKYWIGVLLVAQYVIGSATPAKTRLLACFSESNSSSHSSS